MGVELEAEARMLRAELPLNEAVAEQAAVVKTEDAMSEVGSPVDGGSPFEVSSTAAEEPPAKKPRRFSCKICRSTTYGGACKNKECKKAKKKPFGLKRLPTRLPARLPRMVNRVAILTRIEAVNDSSCS